MQQYGPVVLLPELLAPDESLENLKFERSTFDECVEYVASEFDQAAAGLPLVHTDVNQYRSEEHTSELQSLMRISYAVFCLKKKNNTQTNKKQEYQLIKHKI